MEAPKKRSKPINAVSSIEKVKASYFVLANFASFARAWECASETKVGFNYGCGFGMSG